MQAFLQMSPNTENTNFKLLLHGCGRLSRRHVAELLHVGVQAVSRNLRAAAHGGLQQGVVDEHVLILRLHHVVPLSSHAGHQTVNVHRLLTLQSVQHGVDDDEAACAPHPRANIRQKNHKC